ncbi:MAG: hypothetical protein HDT43_10505 [Ruminococcaceae bacterium]|nr:hypothetical protein [Oscillospiraceae bacterium]
MKKTLILSLVLAVFLCGCAERRESVSELLPNNAADDLDIADSPESLAESEESTVKLSREGKSLVGVWYNSENLSEEWVFSEDGIVVIDGTAHNFSAGRSLMRKKFYIRIDGERCYIDDFYGGCDKIAFQFGDEKITLLAADSAEFRETEKQRLYETECAELFARYPDNDGWTKQFDCGDIPLLADADYIERSAAQGVFLVSTPQELASFCWYVNTQECVIAFMQLTADIDLEGYDWAPMGWAGDHPFNGMVDGAGHTISNMKIAGFSDSGFIGWETFCYLGNISFADAKVQGGMAGIAAGQAIGGTYENVQVSGEVNGSSAGSMLGWDANCTKKNCTADVLVNGEKFDFLSFNDKEKSEIVIENPVEITIDDNHTVTRPEVEGYRNLGWVVIYNGEQVLDRNAENELSYTYFYTAPGEYEIYLNAFVQGQYVPISNTVSYTIQ